MVHDSPPVPNAIVATSSDSSGNLYSRADYGVNHVDLAAPVSTDTSFAAGYVSGAIGVLTALNPGLSYTAIRNLVTQNVEHESGLSGKTITGGMISAYNSLLAGIGVNPTASASAAPVTTKQTTLSVTDSYGGGDAGLTYTWNVTAEPSGVTPPAFSVNGTNGAKSTSVTFYAAGTYMFQATIADGQGFQKTASVSVMVDQTATSITISPATATVNDGQNQGFAALVNDQFGAQISSPSLAWSVNGGGVGGAINPSSGLYTAPSSGAGTDTVKVTSGSASKTATVTVTSPTGGSVSIDCGSSAGSPPFAADTSYVTYTSGGPYSTTNNVDTSGVTNPAPMAVYQTGQYGNFTDTVTGLTPGGSYSVLLQFVEFAHNAPGQREFDVYVNSASQPALTDYDIYAQAGAMDKAVTATISGTADANGDLALKFVTVIDGAYCSAITVTPVQNGQMIVMSPVAPSPVPKTGQANSGSAPSATLYLPRVGLFNTGSPTDALPSVGPPVKISPTLSAPSIQVSYTGGAEATAAPLALGWVTQPVNVLSDVRKKK